MDFPYLKIGFKLLLRNKRRWIIIMVGALIALSVISSIYLISASKSRNFALQMIKDYNPVFSVTSRSESYNITELEETTQIIEDLDKLKYHIIDNFSRLLYINARYNLTVDDYYYNQTEKKILFMTKNPAVDWNNLSINTSFYSDLIYITDDSLKSMFNKKFSLDFGNLPENDNEIIVSSTVASHLGITLNDTISIGYGYNEKMISGFKVVGIFRYAGDPEYKRVFMNYDAFKSMVINATESDVVFDFNSASVDIYVNFDSVSIYSFNMMAEKINQMGNEISNVIDNRGYALYFSNNIQFVTGPGFKLALYMIILLFSVILFGCLSPLVFLSNHVSILTGQEIFESREREFSQFRSKGFSKKQMQKTISSEIFLSTMICFAISATSGYLLAWLLNDSVTFSSLPQASTSITPFTPSFNPFMDITSFLIYIAMMLFFSFIFVSAIYSKPIRYAFIKEMMDSLKRKIKEKKKKSQANISLILSLLFGITPVIIQVIFLIVTSSGILIPYLGIIDLMMSILLVAAPFILAYFFLSYIGDKKPDILANLVSRLIGEKNVAMKNFFSKNIKFKSKKIVSIMTIVMFTIGFGLFTATVSKTLYNYSEHYKQYSIASDIKSEVQMNVTTFNFTENKIAMSSNVSSQSWDLIAEGTITNQNSPSIDYAYPIFHFINLSLFYNTTALKINDYFFNLNWKQIFNQIKENPRVALLPIEIKPYITNDTLDIKVEFRDAFFNSQVVEESFRVIGYYKLFPGIKLEQSLNGYIYNPAIILHSNIKEIIPDNCSADLRMNVFIKTIHDNQESINATAASLGLSNYQILSNAKTHPIVSTLQSFSFFDYFNFDYY
ncbi:MAG: ABC transporter permease, partial [Promethearchaeota archaeon]